jgi:Mg-chelatase subunit ChlD
VTEKPQGFDDGRGIERIRLAGKVSDADMMRLKMKQGLKNPDLFEKLSHDMNYDEIQQMAEEAMDQENVGALLGLSQSNRYAVSSSLSSERGAKFLQKKAKEEEDSYYFSQLYFMLRNTALPKYKILFRHLARRSILHTSFKISGKGLRGDVRKFTRYKPGMVEFDLDSTLQAFIEKRILPYWDIMGVERRKRKKVGVLMVDTSGSMYGRLLLNAALSAAVLAYHMAKTDKYAIIVFNSKALVLKGINATRNPDAIVNDILDSEAVGFTNIEAALQEGLNELGKYPAPDKFGILITDGEYNRGEDPVAEARHFRHLHVINIPPEQEFNTKGLEKCAEIAHAGRGNLVKVRQYGDIPRALLRLLRKL